ESTRRNVPVETTNSLALVSCDGLGGYDWSDQAKDGPNDALMAYSTSSSDFEVPTDSNCSKTCLETVKLFKYQNVQLLKDLKKSEIMVLGYKSEEFTSEPAVETLNAKTSEDVPKVVKNDNGAPIIKDWESDDEDESVPQPKMEKKIVKPSIAKVEFVKPKQQSQNARKNVKKCFDHLQKECNYHQRRFQNQKMVKPVWNYNQRVNHKNFAKNTHPFPKRNIVPRAILMKSGIKSINAARQNFSKAAVTVNTARPANTAHPKTTMNAVKTRLKAVLNVVKGNEVYAVKASACWVWKPKTKGNPQVDLQEKGVIDSGCSRHMTGNVSYLTDYEEINRGYVAFGGNPK
nr:hypothetical protein [Tanacetum cinerariifolium]